MQALATRMRPRAIFFQSFTPPTRDRRACRMPHLQACSKGISWPLLQASAIRTLDFPSPQPCRPSYQRFGLVCKFHSPAFSSLRPSHLHINDKMELRRLMPKHPGRHFAQIMSSSATGLRLRDKRRVRHPRSRKDTCGV